jgi:hypothetical protein
LVSKEQYKGNKKYYKKKAKTWKSSRRKELDRLILESKSVPCTDCEFPYPHYVLEFDHVKGVKVSEVSKMVADNCSIESIKEEISKCEVVCANCHKIRHHTRRELKSDGYRGRKTPKQRPKKGTWPDKDALQQLVLSQPSLEVAKLVGVSSGAIKKMCARLGLETRPRGYWAKLRSTQNTPV